MTRRPLLIGLVAILALASAPTTRADFWSDVGGFFTDVGNGIADFAVGVADTVGDVVTNVVDVVENIDSVGDVFMAPINVVESVEGTVIEHVGDGLGISDITDSIAYGIENWDESLGIENAIDTVVDKAGEIVGIGGGGDSVAAEAAANGTETTGEVAEEESEGASSLKNFGGFVKTTASIAAKAPMFLG